MAKRRTNKERLLAKYVASESGCWEWTAYKNVKGYGVLWNNEILRIELAHAIAYRCLKGPIPEGMEIDHLCRNRACINPEHLEAVTHKTNIHRSDSPAMRRHRTGKCKNGHAMSGDNVYTWTNGKRTVRQCRICEDARNYIRRRRAGKPIRVPMRDTVCRSTQPVHPEF